MDKRNLVEGLQKAFNTDDRQRNTSDTSDVEYKENTNTLYIKNRKPTIWKKTFSPPLPCQRRRFLSVFMRNDIKHVKHA